MADRHDALVAITRRVQPATVRAVFYQASVLGVVGKDEAGYRRVQRDLVTLRQEGRIPFGWIVDGTRWMRKPRTFDCLADALADTAQFYRRSLWQRADTYLEVWIEKDALAGTIFPVTSEFDVPLMVARGYASLTFLHEAAEAIVAQQRPVSILHLGDYDPSGINAAEKIEETLRTYAPAADITFRRLAVTDEQIQRLNLPSRPTKASDSRAAGWGDRVSVELDAIDPRVLRNLLREEIEAILPEHELAVLREAEASERELLQAIAGQYGRDVEEVGP
jgi:hypothetical protein